ncbi:hypothetical protein P7K49_029170 [Saguinus oedipus]|uniref:Uncharacterized protein n=1 Tax=Saguinus oedipus TaxID=9490 RepID=A0ABQ9U6F3_SAGOE|nr:hypothetical protein P7K49_029170 [Saguinus oedipus]
MGPGGPAPAPARASCGPSLRPAMDPVPGTLDLRAATPALLGDVLREEFGPLPQLAAICRLKRLPSGGYSSTEDLQLVLERRRVANAKERERVRGPRGRRPPPTSQLHHQTPGDLQLPGPPAPPEGRENGSGLCCSVGGRCSGRLTR